MSKFKLITPYTEVEIEIKPEDEWCKEEVEEWICTKCGVPSKKMVEKIMGGFERKKREVLDKILEDQR